MTTENRNYSASATEPVFTCCLCRLVDAAGNVLPAPRYASVRFCAECRHGVCQDHINPCGFCQACCVKQHGGRE